MNSQYFQVCDFNNSYVKWEGEYDPSDTRKPGHMPWGNRLRIQLDARCELTDEETGETEEFFLITPCRTEWMYRSDLLWQMPNYEYCGIFSRTEVMAGHVKVEKTEFGGDINSPQTVEGSYIDYRITKRGFPKAQRLANDEQVIKATLKDLMLIGRTEIEDVTGRLRAMIEYPIKTMNIQEKHGRFQVDTGPLPFPDLASPVDRTIEKFSMAFVCYNTFDLAEFVLRRPTPVMAGGKEVVSLFEYSDVRRVAAKNSIFCVGNL